MVSLLPVAFAARLPTHLLVLQPNLCTEAKGNKRPF